MRGIQVLTLTTVTAMCVGCGESDSATSRGGGGAAGTPSGTGGTFNATFPDDDYLVYP